MTQSHCLLTHCLSLSMELTTMVKTLLLQLLLTARMKPKTC